MLFGLPAELLKKILKNLGAFGPARMVTLTLIFCSGAIAVDGIADEDNKLIIELLPDLGDHAAGAVSNEKPQDNPSYFSPLEFESGAVTSRLLRKQNDSSSSSSAILPGTVKGSVSQGITVDAGAQGSYSPSIFVNGRAADRMNIFYGSVPLLDFHTPREVFRLLPAALISGARSQSGIPNVTDASDDFYPSLVYDPCEASCANAGLPGSTKTHGGFAQIGTDTFRSIETAAGFGAVLSRRQGDTNQARSPNLGFWGVDVVRDSGQIVVKDNNNTPLMSSDDRNVKLGNNDWTRQSAVHTSSFLLPDFNTRLRTSLLASELEEGLSLGPGYLRNQTRALRRLGIAEFTSESLLGADGTRARMQLRLLDTRSSIRRSAAQLSEPAVLATGSLVSFGTLIRTPHDMNSRFRQLTLASDMSYLEGSQVVRSGSAQERSMVSRESRISQRIGMAFGLARPAGMDLGVGVTSQILFAESRVKTGCQGFVDSECNKVSDLAGLTPPQSGALLLLQGNSAKAGLFVRNQLRRPSLIERMGNATGVLPNPGLVDEKREALGVVAAMDKTELTLETARERNLVVLETGSAGISKFVNVEDRIIRNHASITTGFELPGIGGAAIRYDHTRAYSSSEGADATKPKQLPRTPRHVAAVSLFSAEQQVYSVDSAALLWSFGLGAQWRDRIFLDQKNTLVADGQGSFVPETTLRWAKPMTSIRLSVGTVIALPRETSVRDSIGTTTVPESTTGGGLLNQEPSYFVKLRGEF
jgi:hypothetical protein